MSLIALATPLDRFGTVLILIGVLLRDEPLADCARPAGAGIPNTDWADGSDGLLDDKNDVDSEDMENPMYPNYDGAFHQMPRPFNASSKDQNRGMPSLAALLRGTLI